MSSSKLAAAISKDNEPKLSGRLQTKEHPKAWRALTRDPWILRIAEEGVKIQLNKTKLKMAVREPRPLSWENPSPDQKDWQEKVIKWGAIEKVISEDPDQIIHNLVAAPKSGRICSNTRVLNTASKKMTIKMQSISSVRNMIEEDEWVLQLDLSKYYWAMQIHPNSRKYFRFRIGGQLYQWRVMPFGFINAMQIMKRLMDVVRKKFRQWGINSTCWVDDLVLFLGKDRHTAEILAEKAVSLLKKLGYIINQEKTQKEVSKTFTFRGFDFDTKNYKISVPSTRLRDIRRQAARTPDVVSPRQLACLIGKIRYAANVDRNIVARIVELEIAKKEMLRRSKNWDQAHTLPTAAQEERTYWRTCRDQRPTPIKTDWTKAEVAQGDAGPQGYGYLNDHSEGVGAWTDEQAAASTNHREIAVRAIYNIENATEMKTLQVFETDSTVHAAVAKRIYTKSEALSRQTARIVIHLEKHGIRQKVVHVSQEEIERADRLSRIKTDEDLSLAQSAFDRLCREWKINPEIDLFASRFSKKCRKFYTEAEGDTSASAVNAFDQIWTDKHLYLFPPPKKAYRALKKLRASKGWITAMFLIPDNPYEATFQLLSTRAVNSTRIPLSQITLPFSSKRQKRFSNFRAFYLQASTI